MIFKPGGKGLLGIESIVKFLNMITNVTIFSLKFIEKSLENMSSMFVRNQLDRLYM